MRVSQTKIGPFRVSKMLAASKRCCTWFQLIYGRRSYFFWISQFRQSLLGPVPQHFYCQLVRILQLWVLVFLYCLAILRCRYWDGYQWVLTPSQGPDHPISGTCRVDRLKAAVRRPSGVQNDSYSCLVSGLLSEHPVEGGFLFLLIPLAELKQTLSTDHLLWCPLLARSPNSLCEFRFSMQKKVSSLLILDHFDIRCAFSRKTLQWYT